MPITHAFPKEELASRLVAVRQEMKKNNLDAILVAVPENIYYLTGLDHWGYFACHVLFVPLEGDMILICRQMEQVSVERYVLNANFYGFKDYENPADFIFKAIKDSKCDTSNIGIEKNSLFLTPAIYEEVINKLSKANCSNCSGLVDELRQVKSPLEIEYTRKAAEAADVGALAAIEAAKDGASDRDISAEMHSAMIKAGSEYAGFGPFIRMTDRLNEEHTTWRGDVMKTGDALYIEHAGSYKKYQAPMGRLIFIGEKPHDADFAADLSNKAGEAQLKAIKPGATTGDVYKAWQDVVDAAGLPEYRRHHCGYLVGIAFPPSWVGGSMVTGLAPNSKRILKVGMVFHTHSWLMWSGKGDFFYSNTVILTENGAEVLTNKTPTSLIVT